MKYYYIQHTDSIGLIASNNDHPYATAEITENEYREISNKLDGNKIIYLDNNNKLQLRDRYTKWDKMTKAWIPDDEAITLKQKNEFKNKAQALLNETAYYETESYRATCTEVENKANLTYRIQLYKILKDIDNITELPVNPNMK